MRPQRSNSGPTTPIGPIPTRACVPLSARRCYRGRRAMGRRRRADVPRPCGGHRRHCRPRRPLHRPPRPPERGARCVPKVEPVHACAHRNRHERRPPLPPLPSRGLSPHSTSLTTHPASSAPRSQSCAPPACRRRAADGPSVGRPGRASAAVATLVCRLRRAQTAGDADSA